MNSVPTCNRDDFVYLNPLDALLYEFYAYEHAGTIPISEYYGASDTPNHYLYVSVSFQKVSKVRSLCTTEVTDNQTQT